MNYLKVEVFTVEESLEELIEALNDEGLLGDGNYDHCYAITRVLGHFRPLEGANPAIGEIGKVEEVEELKLEFRIEESQKEICESIIKKHHPYEVPVINFLKMI